MNLAKYSLDNTKIIYFFLAVLLIGGIFSFDRLGKKENAPFVIKTAVIMTRYPGAEPAEVERLITEPISREIQSMSGVNKIKSESMYGLSKITFELQPSLSAASIPQKWDELRRKVLNIQPQLPAGASVPTVSDDFGDVFGIYYGLVGDDGFSYEEMRDWAERIKTQVITAEGVMKVALFGTQTEVVNIFISVSKLAGMGIDPKQLANLLQSQNQIINTGEISAGGQQLRIVANGTYTTINNLRTLPVFGTTRETTTLEQVVGEFDYQYKFSNVKDYNRQMVMMAQADPRRGVNAIAAFNRVWEQVQKEINVPEGYTMKYFGEQESQAESNAALATNMPLTFFLMFVTLLFLFRTYRKPIVILLMLPLIFIGIVLGLLLLGKTFDFFAILGLLGLIGMNIKNAIVLVDQIDAETTAGKTPREAVISATTTRIVPVAMASGTTILGMLPLLFDAMFGGMAATIMGGLLVASILTLFVLPVAYCAIHRIKG